MAGDGGRNTFDVYDIAKHSMKRSIFRYLTPTFNPLATYIILILLITV